MLDRLADDEGVPSALVRQLLCEQGRTRADGRAGLRVAIESLIDASAVDVTMKLDRDAH